MPLPEDRDSRRAAVEAGLLQQAQLVVSRLEAALAAAPDDVELRGSLTSLLEHARRLRDEVHEVIAKSTVERERREPRPG